MKAPKCWTCDGRHWSTQPCPANPAPKNASNEPAINKERLTDAINAVAQEEPEGVVSGPDLPRVPRRRAGEPSVAGRTPNRRSREAYNAYMKTYMARRRHEAR